MPSILRQLTSETPTFFNSDISDVGTTVLEITFEGRDLGSLVENEFSRAKLHY